MTERKKKRKNVKKREGEKVCIIFIEFIYWVHYIHASKRFDFYITKVNTSMESQPLSINELKNAFFSLNINKSPGHDGVSFNVIKNVLVSYVNL